MASLLSGTTIGGHVAVHANNISTYALTSLPSHNHDDRYYTESEIDSQISQRLYQVSISGLNVNSFHGTGIYRGSTGDWSNRPSVIHNGGALFTIDTHPGNYHSQLFFDTGGDRLYFRNANAGSWGSWLTMIHSGNIGSQSVNYANYANSAGNADTVDGYHESSFWRDGQDRRIGILRFTGEGGNSGNGTIAYGIYQEGGDWAYPYPNLRINMHTGISFGANASYGGYRFMSDYNTDTIIFSVNDGDANVRVTNNLYIGSAGGWITDLLNAKLSTGGKAADSELLDGLDSSRFLYTTTGQFSGDWNTLTDSDYEIRLVEVHNITGGAHSNHPTGLYTYGSVLGWQLENSTFKLYNSHTGDLAFQTGWNNDGYSGWRTIIHSANIGSQSVSYATSAGSAISATSSSNSNYLNTTRDTPSSSLQYWQASGLGIDEAPSGDWYNTIRMGHGSPLSYYSNTLAIRMTGGGEGDIYTQTIMNGNRQGWKKHWNDGNDGAGSGLDADLLDGQQGSYYINTSNIGSQAVTRASYVSSNLWSGDSQNEAVRVFAPAGASASWDSGITGAFRIKLPQRANNTMWTMKVRIYNYAGQQTSEYTLGNYSYNEGGYNASAQFTGAVNASPMNVRFGNQDGVDCVWIGETNTSWSYPVVSVIDFTGGFRNGNAATWEDSWNITYVTEFGTVASTIYPDTRVGNLHVTNNLYASIMYDADNQNYFVDPAGTSSLNVQYVNTLYPGPTQWFLNTGAQINLENQGTFARFAFNGLDFYDWQYGVSMTISNGDITANNSFRAPIFYDSNDTNYYVDPNSTSNLAASYIGRVLINYDGTDTWFRMQSGNRMRITTTGGTDFIIPNTGEMTYNGNTVIHAGNIGSQSVSYATSAGSASTATTAATSSNTTQFYAAGGSQIKSSTAGTSYGNHIQVRESDGGYGNTDSQFEPALGFHWGNVVASNIAMEASGRIAIKNNPGSSYEAFISSITYSSESARAPIFYDLNDTNYYVDPNGTSNLSRLLVPNASSGASLIVGTNNTSRVYNDDARKGLVVNADYYPHIYVNALSNASNNVHGAVISMTGTLSAGGYRRWGMGIANTDPSALSWGWWDNEPNPHYSVGGSLGYTSTGSRMWLDTSGNLQTTGSMRAPIFYDSNNTNYYVDPASGSNLYGGNGSFVIQGTWPQLRIAQNDGTPDASINYDAGDGYRKWNVGPGAGEAEGDEFGFAIYEETRGTHYGTPLRINALTGYVQIGDRDNPAYQLDVSGYGYFRDNIGIATTPRSDAYKISMGGSIHLNGNSVDYVGSLYLEGSGTGGHLQPNAGPYGTLQITGSKNSWTGLRFTESAVTLMMNSNESGHHNDNYGWQFRWQDGTLYCHKNSNGGGASATVWDSSNAPRANYGNLMYYQGFNLDANTMDSNSTGFTYQVNAPTYGPIVRFSTGGGYDLWLNSDYWSGSDLYFRTRNGDTASLNNWRRTLNATSDVYAANMNQYVRTSDDVTFNTTTAPTILINNHSDNTKGYRIHNTSGSSVSAMFTNSSNYLTIGAGSFARINLNKDVHVNGVSLGVGTIAPSGTVGRIDASNDIVAFNSSDERLKQNITPIENALDKVKSLTGVEFDWKPEYKYAHGHEGHDTGIIAQQVQEVIPSAVRTNDTGFLAVRYEKLIGLLVEGMKEQQAQIEELKAKLDGLTK